MLVKLNGPRYWMLDGLGSKAQPIEPVMREFGGIMMRRIAVLNLGNEPAQIPYTVRLSIAEPSSSSTPAAVSSNWSTRTGPSTSCRPAASASTRR